MDLQKLLLSSLAMSIFLYQFSHSDLDELFASYFHGTYADAPTSDGPDELKFSPTPRPRVFDVDDHGAKANGTDDSKAFLDAWREACNSSHYPSVFLVPEGRTYLLMPLGFNGPCKSKRISAMIMGTLDAPSNRSVWLDSGYREWITFEKIKHLHVTGGGMLNGNGYVWWINSCKTYDSMPCVTGPTALYFRSCKHLVVEDLMVRDSMQMHVVLAYSRDVQVSKLVVVAPGWSPNTDGIHVSNSNNVIISDCIISTGDDCISIVSGSWNVKASGIFCGPGHGISIGSLGARNARAHVFDVLVEKAILVGTTNGVRIKTWQGGHGYAKRIIFQDISMYNVSNPIVINQSYCDSKVPCHKQGSAVATSNVYYRNIHGTSASDVAIKFDCSSAIHCDNIVMQDIFSLEKEEKLHVLTKMLKLYH